MLHDTRRQPEKKTPEPVATTEEGVVELRIGDVYLYRPLKVRARLERITPGGVHLVGLAGPVDPRNISPVH